MRCATSWPRRCHERVVRRARGFCRLHAAPARQGHDAARGADGLRGDAARRLPAGTVPSAWPGRTGMLPIECGEAIEGVDLQATVIAALAIEPGNRVLEIGTGSGYTAAVMARLAARVVTVDRYRTLTEQARQRFENARHLQRLRAPGRRRPTGWRARGLSTASSCGRPSTACRAPSSTSWPPPAS